LENHFPQQGKPYKFNLGIKRLIVGQGFIVWMKFRKKSIGQAFL
jgi:hypothetical protein